MVPVLNRTFGLLAIVAAASVVVAFVAAATGRLPDSARQPGMFFAWGVVTVATAGSLWASEIAGYVPCVLCWYQRIAMYPLVIIIGVALLTGDRNVWKTVVPISAIGMFFAGWHVFIERFPAAGGVCSTDAPCAVRWINEFGFMTLPTMAFIAFAVAATFTYLAREKTDG